MHSKEFIAGKLLEAANAMRLLSDEIQRLVESNDALLAKVASLESALDDKLEVSITGAEASLGALQKEASFVGFTPRSANGFGSSVDDIPQFESSISAEARLDMILTGETPSDYN